METYTLFYLSILLFTLPIPFFGMPSWLHNFYTRDGLVFFMALNNAPSVNLDVFIPVIPRNSTGLNPVFSIIATRSLTGTAPPIQPVQWSRLFTTFSGRLSFSTTSAN